ncbi:hypothetical protein J6TS2_48830 [Heyndrickxia sporothermodurans]|nr:hypothetical protein J6TS2_48830 [Heyndrickxia sporothermodurans]
MENTSSNTEKLKIKKVNIFLVCFLSIITLGVYIGYWFLSRKKALIQIKEKNYIPFTLWWLFTIVLILSFIYQLIGGVFLTDLGIAFFDSMDVIFSSFFLAILYYSVFRIRDLYEDALNEEVFNPVFLVLFHIWYLQYKINRLEEVGRG